MAKNKQTYMLQIDAEISSLENKLSSVKNLLSNVLNSTNPPKGLDKSLEKIEGLVDRIKAKASQPIDSKASFTSMSKDVESVQIALAGVLKVVESINKMSEIDKINFLPPEARQQIEQIVNGLDSYVTAVQAATTESKELTAAREKLAAAEDRVAAAQAKVNQKQTNLDQAKVEQKAAEDAIAAIEARKKKLVELKETQKQIEQFYSSVDAEGNKRNRSKKYDEVSMRPQDIKRKIAELEKASAGDGESLKAYRQELKAAKSDVESYIVQLSTANRTLHDAQEEQSQLATTVDTLSKTFEAAKPEALQAAYSNLRQTVRDLGIDLEGIGEEYTEQNAEKLIKSLVALREQGFEELESSINDSTREIESFGGELKEVKGKVEEGTEALEDLNEAAAEQRAFENKIKQFLGVAGATQVLRAAAQDAIATIKELDATMTEMAVVTDLSVGDYWNQLPEYSKRASDLGVSVNSAYKAATLYYQQGLKTNEVNAISAETLKMAKIAGLDAADATDKMTAALRGFNMELNEASAQRVSDVYSELAAITAADTKEIASAMTKTASIASSAGMEFETTAAFLSQIIETTRESAETAGTAMKTVIARFQELKKAPSEIGEVDGEIVDANAIETALRSVGVSLRDSAGQFRDLDDVFLELSSKWDGLDKNTQRYIATIAAGSRQQSRFIAMMSNYSRTQELVTAANTSAGASNKQFEKTVDSLEAKMEKLRNAWHEFTMGIMNSDLVKFGVDVLTKFLEVVNKATNGMNGLGGSITKILTILTVFKLGKTVFEKLRAPMVQFFADIVREAGIAGEAAGRAAKEGLERSKRVGANGGGAPTLGSQSSLKGKISQKLGWAEVISVSKNVKQNKSKIASIDINALRERSASQGRAIEGMGASISDKKNVINEAVLRREALGAKLADLKTKEGGAREIAELQGEYSKTEQTVTRLNGELVNLEEAQRNLIKGQQKTNSELQEYEELNKKIGDAGQEYWKATGQAIQKTGAAITGVGVAASALGGIFSSLGLDWLGEAFTKAGNAIIMVGGAVSALGAIIPVVTSILSACGISLQASFWPILVIGLAIAALIGTIALLIASFKALKASTPEGKLEAAKEKTDKLSGAAQQAAEAFEQLNDSISDLGDKYEELDDMVQGTKAWRDAVREVNKQVMELIEQYPELASFIENTDGVLRIDFEKRAVQEILDKYESRMMTTQAAAQLSKAEESVAETNVIYSKVKNKNLNATNEDKWKALGNAAISAIPGLSVGSSGKVEWNWGDLGTYFGASILGGPIGLYGSMAADAISSYNKSLEADSKELNEKIAQAMNNGLIDSYDSLIEFLNDPENGLEQYTSMAGEIWDNRDSFKEYRKALEEETNQREAVTKALLASAQGVADLSGFTIEDNKIMASLEEALDINLEQIKADLEKTKWHKTENLSDEEYAQLSKAVKAQYGEEAKIEGNKIKYYDADNNLQTVKIKQVTDRLISQMASDKAVKDTKDSIEAIPELRKQFASDSKMLALLSGETTLNQLNKLKQIGFSDFSKEQIEALKSVYGDNYKEILERKLKDELDGFKTAEKKLKNIKISEVFGDVSAEAANALADIATNAGWGGTNNFVKAFQQAQGSLGTVSNKNQFSALLGSMEGKETLRESWEGLENQLKEQKLWNEEVAKFITEAIEKTGATYSQTHLSAMGVSDELYSHYQQAIISNNAEVVDNFHKTFKKWKQDYDVANDEGKKAEHELKTAISDALTKSAEEEIDKLQDLTDAVNKTNEKMLQAIQKQISEQREARNNEKEEENLNNLRNRVAYLRASGANPLELMQAEEELAATEEGYTDKLIDQSIAKLEDANEKAASQREEQINLLRSQLEFWKETQGFKDEVDRIFEESRMILESGGLIQDTEIWKLLGYDELSEYEQSIKAMGLNEQLGKTLEAAETTPSESPTLPKKKTVVAPSISTASTGGSSSVKAESLRFNRDFASPTHQVFEEEEEGSAWLPYAVYSTELVNEKGAKPLNTDELRKGVADKVRLNLDGQKDWIKCVGGTSDPFINDFVSKNSIKDNSLFSYQSSKNGPIVWYVAKHNQAWQVDTSSFNKNFLKKLESSSPTRYKTGGLADFTGPAWLDGTKSRPEYVLNAAQTERFFSLVDVLEGIDTNKTSVGVSGGDNHFEIEINVDKLENDYDVEQLADKIRRMLYEDATYRNVRAVGFIR